MKQATRIMIRLLTLGITQTVLARELGVTQGMISMVIRGERISHRIMHHIAKRLGCPVRELFGDEYERRSRDRRKSERRKKTRRAS